MARMPTGTGVCSSDAIFWVAGGKSRCMMILSPDINQIRAGLDAQGSVLRGIKKSAIHDIRRRAINLEGGGAEADGSLRHPALFRAVEPPPHPSRKMRNGKGNSR